MKSRIVAALALVVSLACCAFGQSVHQIAVPDSSGYPKVVTEANPLPVAGSISSITADGSFRPVTEWDEQVVTLSANVAATFTTEISGTRQFVELTAQDPAIEFWVSVGGTAAIAGCRPVIGSIYLEAPKTSVISLIASQAVKISIVEGGY